MKLNYATRERYIYFFVVRKSSNTLRVVVENATIVFNLQGKGVEAAIIKSAPNRIMTPACNRFLYVFAHVGVGVGRFFARACEKVQISLGKVSLS